VTAAETIAADIQSVLDSIGATELVSNLVHNIAEEP